MSHEHGGGGGGTKEGEIQKKLAELVKAVPFIGWLVTMMMGGGGKSGGGGHGHH